MESLVLEFLNPKNVIAVVGVSRNPEKYGHQIYFTLKKEGYKVYAVNPNIDSVNGDKVYPSLSSLPVVPDVVDLVVPPNVGIGVIKEAYRLGIKRIWMQPGAESDELIRFCKEHGLKALYGMCIMVESVRRSFK